MPANVESMFSVRQMPWHREGLIVEDYPGSWDEARKLAGLDWDPVAAPVYALAPPEETASMLSLLGLAGASGEPANGPSYQEIGGWKLIKRSDNGAVLSVRPDSYAIIDHGEMGEIVEAVLAQPGVKWETAGSLNGGRAVWCLAYLDEPIELPGDKSLTLPYLAVTNRHDGTAACALRATTIRIVCANTFGASELEGERTGTVFSFVHRDGWRDRIDEARQAVTGARREFARYRELAGHLLGIKVTPEQRETFVRVFIPMPPEGMITDRVAANVEQSRNAVRGILDGTTTDGISYTAFGLVQAAGEYLDHVRQARSWETRLGRSLLRPEPGKHRAMQLVEEIVGV